MAKEKQIGKNNYVVSEEVRALANQILEKEIIAHQVKDVKVEYLIVYPSVSKLCAGRCYKAHKHTKFFSDFDFIIELSGNLWESLDEQTKYILLLHEMMHIKVMYNKKGEKQLGIKDHDVQDFSYIIKKYGIDWITNVQTEFASVHDLDETEEKKVTL